MAGLQQHIRYKTRRTKHTEQNAHEKIYGKKHAEESIWNETNAEDNTRKKQAEHTQKQTNYNTRNKAYAKNNNTKKHQLNESVVCCFSLLSFTVPFIWVPSVLCDHESVKPTGQALIKSSRANISFQYKTCLDFDILSLSN